ncbi:hypothetical protein FKW77_010429 [Venturia effusa]|uniref:Uncharacterized protein n=1 Tax=Venturia effusa TaxID=50376 RepID=A0A517L0H3_9PEZI|nr:hypothetical protein FKW77_010429 [Venturia effusa]
MAQPDSCRPFPEEDTPKKPTQNPRNSFNALFNSIFALPKSIYNRGNEHGRAFTKRQQSEIDDGGNPRPRSARRECARWEGQGYKGCDSRAEQSHLGNNVDSQAEVKPEAVSKDMESKIEGEVDDWVQKIVGDLERGEKEARKLYEQWMTVSNSNHTHQASARDDPEQTNKEGGPTRLPQASQTSAWAELFPSWSTEGREHGDRQHVFTRDIQHHQRSHKPARDVDETTEKPYKDLDRWLSDANRWRGRFHREFERDSRFWQEEGLFGPSMPFSKPLSALFPLGMRPFLPEQSAIGYLLYSEYSPLHLEHEDGFDSSFRERFEDLLRVQDGKTMLSREECAAGKPTSSVDWLGRMIPLLKNGDNDGRGQITIANTFGNPAVLPVQERERSIDTSRYTGESHNGGLQTEQDMYEHYFSRLLREPSLVSPDPRSVPQESESRSSRPSVLSTITRTERHVASDGSVTTKTVLKRSFADGSEENSETTETTPATRPASHEQQPEAEQGLTPEIARTKAAPDQETKRGWFWSS